MKSKEQKRTEALQRQTEYDKLSLPQKIARARSQRGNNQRLLKKLEILTKQVIVNGKSHERKAILYKERGQTSESNVFCLEPMVPVPVKTWHATQAAAHQHFKEH